MDKDFELSLSKVAGEKRPATAEFLHHVRPDELEDFLIRLGRYSAEHHMEFLDIHWDGSNARVKMTLVEL